MKLVKKDNNIGLLGTTGRFFVKSNINQQKSNNKQGISNSNFNIEINPLYHEVVPFLNLYATDKLSIANPIFIKNILPYRNE